MIRHVSLRAKILLTIIGITAGILAFVTILFATQNLFDYRNLSDLLLKINTQSNTITQALQGNNVILATEVLQKLKAKPQIIGAEIFGIKNNIPFSYSGREIFPSSFNISAITSDKPSFYLKGQKLEILYPIYKTNQLNSILYVAANLENTASLQNLLEVLILISLIAIFFAIQLEDITLKPLSNLIETIKKVKTKQDYSLRAQKERNDEIGDLVDDFNAMLVSIQANEKLRNEKEIAEKLANAEKKSSQEKSLFLASMSHEIRTPLNGVLGMVQILSLSQLSNEQRDMIETIKISGEALMSVINNILDLSKIEAGKLELDLIDFNLHNLIYETLEIGAIKAHQKGVDIAAYIAKSVPITIKSDKTKIRQILVNLINNAIKFTNSGSINLYISNSDESTIKIQIIDTGIGMEQAVQKKLFKSYAQASFTTTREYGGTGLGLAISKRLVELLGGTITVNSTPGVGTEFSFFIKIHLAENPDKVNFVDRWNLYGKNILCIDKNIVNTTIIKQLFDNFNVNCIQSSETIRQDEFLFQKNFEIIFLDYQLPDCQHIIETVLSKKPDSLIILMVPLGLLFEVELKYPKNNIYFLSKPLNPNKIIDCLDRIYLGKKPLIQNKISLNKNSFFSAQILIVEDDVINQQVILRMLKNLGFQAEVVNNGLDAISAVENKFYDLILMDCEMPKLNGFDATRRIRTLEKTLNRHSKIIALTAHAITSHKEKCLSAGMDDYIPKPIDVNLLTEKLTLWLTK